jgi:hypothetical protein
MPPKASSPLRLTVEGVDDKHSVLNLMKRHGVDWDAPAAPLPYVHDAGSVEQVLDAIAPGVRSYDRFGIIVDADLEPTRRWAQIRDRLRAAGLAAPDAADLAGTVIPGRLPTQRVGVWLMPDNRDPGILEHFLAKLVPVGDGTWPHAEEATRRARDLGAPLADKDVIKGVLYTWLAWREQPGLPFGTALTTRVLGHDSAEALAFVAWFRRLFLDP